MPRSARVTDLRRQNRAQVLRLVAMRHESTRAEIAAELDLSVATVTNVVTDLIAEGFVREAGSVPSNGGRPTARLRLVADSAYFVGADVGEHGVEAALFDLTLTSAASMFVPLSPRSTSAAEVRNVVTASITSLLEANPDCLDRLQGVGLGLPGIVDTSSDGVTTVYAQSLGWPPLTLSDLGPQLEVPVLADNGAKTFAAAELWSGAAQGIAHSVVALVGRGVGAGVISGGRLLRGASSSAGEWGHTKIEVNGRRCSCGGRGCLEAYVGGAAIRERAQDAGLSVDASDERTVLGLLREADRGSDEARGVVDDTVQYLGIGLANLVNMFNPQQLVIGGWAGHLLFSHRAAAIKEAIRANALDKPGEQVKVSESTCSVDPVALGAALLPLERFIEGTITKGQR